MPAEAPVTRATQPGANMGSALGGVGGEALDLDQLVGQPFLSAEVFGDEEGGLLVVGWGSTYGAIRTAVAAAREAGMKVSATHLRWLWPVHPDLGDILSRYDKILVPEINNGQLDRFLRGEFGVDVIGMHRPTSQPGTGTTGHEIPPMCQRSHHARRYLFGRLRKADHPGLPTTDHRGIAAVEPTGPIAHLDPLRVKGRDEGANQGIP